jgi:hypothetical protein
MNVIITNFICGVIMEYITAKEAASKWGISERRVQVLCEQGRIEGVQRLGKAWAIPQNTQKPVDKRKTKHMSD